MTKKELKQLRKELPPGAVKKLAEMHGHTSSYISMILSGQRNGNAYVLSAARKMADEYQKVVTSVKQPQKSS